MNPVAGRPAARAPKGMVACPHALASEAGAAVLREGGSAVDAAIAASAALAVLYPHMTGVGGDAFWLIYDAKRDAVRFLDGGGRGAASASIDWFRERGHAEIPFRGIAPATLTTPGAVSSWVEAHRAYGRLPFKRDLEAAIGFARDGIAVGERLAGWIAATKTDLAVHAETAAIFLPGGAPIVAGGRLANPDLARTLTALAEHGWSGFYEGEIAVEMARYSKAHGGFFDARDLAAQKAVWGEPLRGRYRDVTIYETPAPTQGFTVLEMLNIVEPFGLRAMPALSADRAHLLVQAKQISYHDRDRHLADPRFAEVPLDRLCSREYADARRALVDPARALPWDKVPSYGSLAGDTVFIAAVDGEGNAAGLINSLYGVFGSCAVAGRTGVVLQNRSAYFSLDPAHPNCVAPGKTPMHTLIASLAFRKTERGDGLWAVVGCMGADGQPQIHAQVYTGMIDHGLDIQQAVEAPRWLSGRFALGEARDTLHIEARFPRATIEELERRGHLVDRWGDWNELAGHAHGIVIDPATGERIGGADPRSDGAAIGC